MRFYAGRVEQSALGGCLDVIAWLVDAPPSKIRMRTVPSTPSLGGVRDRDDISLCIEVRHGKGDVPSTPPGNDVAPGNPKVFGPFHPAATTPAGESISNHPEDSSTVLLH